MAKFKFHSALEDIFIDDFDCSVTTAEKVVGRAADSGRYDLNSNKLDELVEKIYSDMELWGE